MKNVTQNTYSIEKIVPLLMTMGFTIHLVNLSSYFEFGKPNLINIISPLLDWVLMGIMLYCAVIMIRFFKRIITKFNLKQLWKKVMLGWVTFYITMSIPGHISYSVFNKSEYLNMWPWWFSPIIMLVYVGIITFFFSFKQKTQLT